MTTPLFWVLMMSWFGWGLRMEIFWFSPSISLKQVGEQSLSLHSTEWNSWVLVRASFFALGATWAKILAWDELRRRGWRMPNRCYVCKAEEEMGDHILLHCPKVSILWQLVFALFHVQWVMHSSVREVLLSWSGFLVSQKRKKAWKVVPLCKFLVYLEGKK